MIDPNLMNGKSNQSKSDVFARVQNNAPKKDVGCSIEGSRPIMTDSDKCDDDHYHDIY